MTASPYILPGLISDKRISFDEIILAISIHTGVSIYEMEGKSRKDNIVLARQLFFYFTRKYTKAPWRKIGEFLNRDHSTVIYGNNAIKGYLKIKDTRTCNAVSDIEYLIKK